MAATGATSPTVAQLPPAPSLTGRSRHSRAEAPQAPSHADPRGCTERLTALTVIVAGGQHGSVRGAGTNVPDFTHLVEQDVLIDNVVFIIEVYDVDLRTTERTSGRHLTKQRQEPPHASPPPSRVTRVALRARASARPSGCAPLKRQA